MTDLLPFMLPVAALGAASLVYICWRIDPAWLLSLGLAATVFSGHWEQLGVPVALDRLLLVIGMVCVIVRTPGARDRPPFRFSLVYWALAAAASYAIVSGVAAHTLDGAGRYTLIDRFGLLPFALFAIAPLAFHSARRRNILMGTLVALGVYLGATALFQAIGPKALVWPDYINDPEVGVHAGRARGPFAQATENGFALSVCAVASVMAAAAWRRQSARILAMATALACSLGLVLALERSIWVGFTLAAVLTLVLFREIRRLLVPALAGLAILVALVFVITPNLSSAAEERRTDTGSVWDRQNTDAAGLRMIAVRPLFGFGWHTFQERSGPYFRQQDDIPLTGTDLILHNVFLSNAVELGLIGALLWFIAVSLAIGAAVLSRGPPELRPWRMGLVMLATEWLIVANFSPLTAAFTHVALWMWAGVLFRPQLQPATVSPPIGSRSRPALVA